MSLEQQSQQLVLPEMPSATRVDTSAMAEEIRRVAELHAADLPPRSSPAYQELGFDAAELDQAAVNAWGSELARRALKAARQSRVS